VKGRLTLAVVGLSLRFMDPFPPNRIVLATGQPGGAYDGFGREYQSRLASEGLRVELRRTAGSVENLERRHLRRQLPLSLGVRIPPGLLDLKAGLPREPITLMAPAALLVCRETLHPRAVEQILAVAQAVHGTGSLLDPPGRFPTRDGVDVPLHDAADSYLSRGESFLSRVLPYWALRWVIQLRVLLLPLVAIWVPLFKILPWLLRWRGNRVLERHYALLRDAEAAVAAAAGPEALREEVTRLEALRGQIEGLARRLQDLALRFEGSHPRLSEVMGVLVDALARLGI